MEIIQAILTTSSTVVLGLEPTNRHFKTLEQ